MKRRPPSTPQTVPRLLLVLIVVLAGGATPPPRLFIPTPGSPTAGRLLEQEHEPHRSLHVTLHADPDPATWRAHDRWSVPIPGEPDAILHVDSTRHASAGMVEVRGHLEGIPGSEVFLTHSDGHVAATFRRLPAPAVLVAPGVSTTHVLRVLDPGTQGICGNGPSLLPVAPTASRRSLHSPRPASTASTIHTLDIAFLHTSAAETAAGGPMGLRTLVGLALLEANDAFTRSEAGIRLRSVGEFPTPYVESGELARDLDRLGRDSDGWLDEVRALRDAHAADLVCLIVESEDSNQLAGIAHQLTDTGSASVARGFLVCVRPYLVGNHTLAHEVGHTLGCGHDRDHAGSGALEPWSYGTRINVDGDVYRTVMAYRPGLQFPHFSNPRVMFRGIPTGTEDTATAADNVRTLNRMAPAMAAVREPLARLGFATATLDVRESADGFRIPLIRSGHIEGARCVIRTLPGSARPDADYLPLEETLVLQPGDAVPEIEIRVQDNHVTEGARAFAIELRDATPGLALGPISILNVTLRDDELEALSPLDSSMPLGSGADYSVHSLAVDTDGRVVAAGGFATFNHLPHPRIVRLLPDGRIDPDFHADVKYRVHGVALLADGRIALGGEFNTVNGATRNRVAVLLADGSADPAFQFEPGANLPVNAIAAAADDQLVIGGQFTRIQGSPALRVARLHRDGRLDPRFDTRQGPDDDVHAIALQQDQRVLIAGSFREIGETACESVARLLPTGQRDVTFRASRGVDGPAHAVCVDAEGRVLVAGAFTKFEGRPVGRLVRLDASGSWDESFLPGLGADGPIFALAIDGEGSIWIGGDFLHVDGNARRRIARLFPDGRVDPAFDPGAGPNEAVLSMAFHNGNSVLIGGRFTEVSGAQRGGIASLLTVAIRPPEFIRATATWGHVEWEARTLPRQLYDVQQSTNLHAWDSVETLRADKDTLRGVLKTGTEPLPSQFIRLERRLE